MPQEHTVDFVLFTVTFASQTCWEQQTTFDSCLRHHWQSSFNLPCVALDRLPAYRSISYKDRRFVPTSHLRLPYRRGSTNVHRATRPCASYCDGTCCFSLHSLLDQPYPCPVRPVITSALLNLYALYHPLDVRIDLPFPRHTTPPALYHHPDRLHSLHNRT